MANNQLREHLIMDTTQFDGPIAKVGKKIEELSKKGKNMGGGFTDSIGNMVGSVSKFDSKMMGAIGTIGKFAGVAGGLAAGVSLADWFANTTAKAVELATEAEGVRLAFKRLNKPDLLDELNRATHNTVSNLELMKQAVKFKDFNLDISQMGTYLAFAQQKAKDTGQSVDYLVDSIVTGLGRQSLQILDNLGLSAAEIKNEMKKGGDMTKAVAEIIKRKMAEAGDYVETAADRAAKKQKELDDALEELGRNFTAGQGAVGDFFHAIEMGAISALNWVSKLLNEMTKVGRLKNAIDRLQGGGKGEKTRTEKEIEQFTNSTNKNATYNNVIAGYDFDIIARRAALERNEKNYNANLKAAGREPTAMLGAEKMYRNTKERLEAEIEALQKMQAEVKASMAAIMSPKSNTPTPTATDTKGKKDKVYPKGSIGWFDQQISKLKEKVKVQVDPEKIKELNEEIRILENKKANLEAGWTPKLLNVTNVLDGKATLNKPPKPLTRETAPSGYTTGTIYDYYDSKKDSVDNIMKNYDMGLIGKEKAIELINAINAELESLGLKPIELDVKLKDNTLQNTMGAIRGVSNAMDSMGSVFRAVGDESTAAAMEIMSSTADMVATVIPQIMALIGVKEGEALASGTASGAKLPFPANIAAIATIVASIMGVIATIASVTGSYANGGIIGGSSYAGDNLIARVNSGEMILNSQQQRNLFNLLDNGGGIGGAGQVEFVLKGSDLYGSVRNYSRVKSLSGINTGIK